ncbi:unnamed protein product [Enterobius vermicularis]|uniref:PH domain-containing protein n=1 Tax=Enterobius vermicularis TaxID=51028 RepID=A0A0N4V3S4_ENTVE|nr:unnamed protein product [Enterobius vermicularis]
MVRNVTDEINRRLNRIHKEELYQKIMERLKNARFDTSTKRQLVHDGEAWKVNGSKRKKKYLILFSDCLLITKSDADSEEPISQFLVWNLSDIDVFEDDHLEREDQFKIQNNDSSQVLTFAVSSKTERDKWVEKINDAVSGACRNPQFDMDREPSSDYESGSMATTSSDLHSPDKPQLLLVPEKTTMCMMEGCGTKFGIRHKKLQCKKCNWIMCENCAGRAPYKCKKSGEYKIGKVCAECYETICDLFNRGQLLSQSRVVQYEDKDKSTRVKTMVNIEGKDYELRDIFEDPPNGIRPKKVIHQNVHQIVSGTVVISLVNAETLVFVGWKGPYAPVVVNPTNLFLFNLLRTLLYAAPEERCIKNLQVSERVSLNAEKKEEKPILGNAKANKIKPEILKASRLGIEKTKWGCLKKDFMTDPWVLSLYNSEMASFKHCSYGQDNKSYNDYTLEGFRFSSTPAKDDGIVFKLTKEDEVFSFQVIHPKTAERFQEIFEECMEEEPDSK